MLTSKKFIEMAKNLVYEYTVEHLDKTDDVEFSHDDVYVVMFSFILGNQKALLSTTLPDGMYYEATYNEDKDEIYLDAYKKFDNKKYSVKK